MPLNVGDYVPDFTAQSTRGEIRFSNLKGRKVVIFFFPKAFTPGCTREVEAFNKALNEFTSRGVEVIGVSADKLSTLQRFAEKYSLQYPLISDSSLEIIKLFGVLGKSGKTAQRVTFVIDHDGKIKAIVKGLKRAEDHPTEALKYL
ncbi:alkyl hydroperoxide reductase [Infirmifilum uzonense]|uniref:thioredoxin-dependent peroxiredoxin n=1 Tax=Infirmifilum uzonense TaxID=1550241 RepID=A0A0F7FH52_9CREN|nr:peroxiredoxin [Infirmifilum uzonense]AKG38599.1 alkyl hydroperoxide reductase [Infirmifilum uzonense]